MRIGTWNLDLRWGEQHRELLLRQNCDVWLLTEVPPKAVNPKGIIAGLHCHLSSEAMDRKQYWAAVLSLEALSPLPDPHPASAAAIINRHYVLFHDPALEKCPGGASLGWRHLFGADCGNGCNPLEKTAEIRLGLGRGLESGPCRDRQRWQ